MEYKNIIRKNKGNSFQSKTGNAFYTLCANNAIYAESCSHTIFEIFLTVGGMVPWLLIVELLSRSKNTVTPAEDKEITQVLAK